VLVSDRQHSQIYLQFIPTLFFNKEINYNHIIENLEILLGGKIIKPTRKWIWQKTNKTTWNHNISHNFITTIYKNSEELLKKNSETQAW